MLLSGNISSVLCPRCPSQLSLAKLSLAKLSLAKLSLAGLISDMMVGWSEDPLKNGIVLTVTQCGASNEPEPHHLTKVPAASQFLPAFCSCCCYQTTLCRLHAVHAVQVVKHKFKHLRLVGGHTHLLVMHSMHKSLCAYPWLPALPISADSCSDANMTLCCQTSSPSLGQKCHLSCRNTHFTPST